jgi:hypothetical protein
MDGEIIKTKNGKLMCLWLESGLHCYQKKRMKTKLQLNIRKTSVQVWKVSFIDRKKLPQKSCSV